jgi:hypothetical protein
MYLEDTLLSSQQHAANKTATYQKQKQNKKQTPQFCVLNILALGL